MVVSKGLTASLSFSVGRTEVARGMVRSARTGISRRSPDSGFDASHHSEMTMDTVSRSRDTMRPSCAGTLPKETRAQAIPKGTQRSRKGTQRSKRDAGNAGCAVHPQSRVQKVVHTGSNHRFTGTPGISCAMVLRLIRALVSEKSVRMCERAVLAKPPVAGSAPVRARRPLEPVGERGTGPVSSSTRTVAWA